MNRLDQATQKGLDPVGDVFLERQGCFGAQDPTNTKYRTQGAVQVLGILGHHAAPHVSAAGDFMDLQYPVQGTQCGEHRVKIAVCDFQCDESEHIESHGAQVNLAASRAQDIEAFEPAQARRNGVPGDRKGICDVSDLGSGIFEQV